MADQGDKYDDVGNLGTFPAGETYRVNPPGIVNFEGQGCSQADYSLGFIKPVIRELAAYDKVNYEQRSTLPLKVDEDQGNRMSLEKDFEFRTRGMEAKGFLTRPRIPTERG